MNETWQQTEAPPSTQSPSVTKISDITVGMVNRQNPEEARVVKETLLKAIGEPIDDPASYASKNFIDMLINSPAVKVIRKRRAASDEFSYDLPIGIVFIGEDEEEQSGPADTLFYTRIHPEHKGEGEMTIGILKVIEGIFKKREIPGRTQRRELRQSKSWGQEKNRIQQNLETRPLRLYIKTENDSSIKMAEALGFHEAGPGVGRHSKETRYELDMDKYESACELQEMRSSSTPLPESILAKAA